MILNYNLAGRYLFLVHKVDAAGNVIRRSRRVAAPWTSNLITNAGLNYLGTHTHDNLAVCRIGSGNNPSTVGDTALQAQVGFTSTAGNGGGGGYDASGNFIWKRVSRRFNAGSVSGHNLAEVAMAGSNALSIFSRSLIRDTSGTPTTINLQPDEVLDVIYELRLYLPTNNRTVNATVDGIATVVTISFSTHANDVSGWADGLGKQMAWVVDNNGDSPNGFSAMADARATTANFFGGGSINTGASHVLRPYVAGSFELIADTTYALTGANYPGGIGAIMCGYRYANRGNVGSGAWQFAFSPKIQKVADRIGQFSAKVKWGRKE